MTYAAFMISRHRLAEVAALIGDPARAGMLTALWDGSARPAGELARLAGVSAATASSHLGRLVAGGVLRVEPRGRHRYYRLAGTHVAEALEALAHLVVPRPASVASDSSGSPLRRARMCYDHVAGVLGVSIADALTTRRMLALRDGSFELSAGGRRWFQRLGVDVGALERGRRPLMRSCIDWTGRREHLGGALGAALATHLLERDWVRRERGARTLLLTTAGRSGLRRSLGLRVP
jgi:DNA-binding transcriptional ArsR family regulator